MFKTLRHRLVRLALETSENSLNRISNPQYRMCRRCRLRMFDSTISCVYVTVCHIDLAFLANLRWMGKGVVFWWRTITPGLRPPNPACRSPRSTVGCDMNMCIYAVNQPLCAYAVVKIVEENYIMEMTAEPRNSQSPGHTTANQSRAVSFATL